MFTRSKRSRFGAAALGLALVASACGSSATDDDATSSDTESAAAGDAAGGAGLPQLVGSTVSGGQIDTNDLAGQDVVVWFWAPW